MARISKDKTVVKPITVPGSIADAITAKAEREGRSFSNTISQLAAAQLRKEGFLPKQVNQA